MKHLSISQQKEKVSWGVDLVKGASKCTAARISEARRARPAGVGQDPHRWRGRGLSLEDCDVLA